MNARIEPLSRAHADAAWMVVREVNELGVASMTSIGRVPRLEARLPIGELTRPFGPVHTEVTTSPQKSAIWRTALETLLAARTPVRVVIDERGWARRPADLFHLLADGTAGARIALQWRLSTWAVHLEKHLTVEGADGGEHFIDRIVELKQLGFRYTPLEPRHLRDALRLARGVPRAERAPLPPQWWPLVELYGELTLESFMHMLHGAAVYGRRDSFAPIPLDPEEDTIEPGEEELLVAPLFELVSVAAGERDPLLWRTTYRRANVFRWLQGRARQFRLCGSCQTHGLPDVSREDT